MSGDRCGTTWGGLSAAHCPACHSTFSTVGNFDRHRSVGKGQERACQPPESVGLLRRANGVWAMPGPEPDYTSLQADLDELERTDPTVTAAAASYDAGGSDHRTAVVRVLGIDPGLTTGYVVREGNAVLAHGLLECDGRPLPTGRDLLNIRWKLDYPATLADVHLVAVEGLVAPNPHLGLTNVTGLLATGMVLGAVLAQWPDAVVVPPSGNGSLPRAAYPAELIGPREGPALGGRMRHCRSAFDVAGKAKFYARGAA